ncbi:DNA topoisomerase III, partial [Candidatus Falkowbacteria bacterium HGW-Falkowbacteria-2]
LCTLLEPHEYDYNWKRWSIDSLPIIPHKYDVKIIENDGVKKQFNVIKSLIEKSEGVINCGDAGQEGELIQRWVLKLAGFNKEFKRLWISSLTEEAIKEGFKKLKSSNDFELLYQAGSARAICDWLIGMNATRAYTTKVSTDGKLLSIGRVQTPTLAMIVNRYLEIMNFIPKKYWELKTLFKNVIFSYEKAKFENPEDANEILGKITNKILIKIKQTGIHIRLFLC